MNKKTSTPNPSIRVGRIVGAFGIRGQVKVEPLTDFIERFAKGARLRIADQWYEVETFALHKGRPLIKLAGINTANDAEALQWAYIEAIGDIDPDLQEDEFLVSDLVGLRVFTDDGDDLGLIDEVLTNPAHDILSVGPILIPLVKEFVLDIDLETEIVKVHLIPGMRPGEE